MVLLLLFVVVEIVEIVAVGVVGVGSLDGVGWFRPTLLVGCLFLFLFCFVFCEIFFVVSGTEFFFCRLNPKSLLESPLEDSFVYSGA